MKISPVSGDLLIKLGIGVAVVGVVAIMIAQLKAKISTGSSTYLDAINPNSTQNLVYSTVNDVWGEALPTAAPGRNADNSWTLGGFLYDVTHPVTAIRVANITGPTGGAPMRQSDPNGNDRYIDAMGNIY